MISSADAALTGARKTTLEKLFKSMVLPTRAEMNDGTAELGMLKPLIPDGSTTIDIGANVGDFSRRLAKLSKTGLVIAFEPQSLPRTVLSLVGYLRKLDRIIV